MKRIIDCHTHIFEDKTYGEYIEKYKVDYFLTISFFKGFLNGMFDQRIEHFDEFISKKENVYLIQGIDFNNDIDKQISQIKSNLKTSNKIRGVKLYTGYQHFFPNDKKLFALYDFCAKNDLPVVFHSGVVALFENCKSYLKYANPLFIDDIAVDFPETKFVISHFGFPYIIDTSIIVYKNKNVFTDVSGTIDHKRVYIPYVEDLKRALNYSPRINTKIMFGTDFIGNDSDYSEVNLYIDLVNEVFNEEDRKLVFFENAKNLYLKEI